MEKTKNMDLNLPGENDFYDVEHFNRNFGIIDGQAARVIDLGNKMNLLTTDKEDLVGAINELKTEVTEAKKSAGDGKSKIAAAITRKKVATAGTDTFDVMAGNIDKIKLGSGNAAAGDVLAGRTFTGDSGVEQTGTMPIKPIWDTIIDISPDPDNAKLNVYIDNGAYLGHSATHNNRHPLSLMFNVLASAIGLTADKIKHGLNICGKAGSFTGDGTITSDKVLTGYKGYSKGQAVNGGIPANNPVTDPTEVRAAGDLKELRMRYPYGYYPKELYAGNYYDPYVKAPYSSVASAFNITPDKIASGHNVCGVEGTHKAVITELGTYTKAANIDIGKYCNNINVLTNLNFYIKINSVHIGYTANNNDFHRGVGGESISYNNVTGILSCKGIGYSGNSGTGVMNVSSNYTVYLVY